MATKEWKIELKTDHFDPQTDEIFGQLIRTAAKHILTQAMLLPARRPPQIVVEIGDHFDCTKEIVLVDSPEEETSEQGDAQKAEGARTHNAEIARVAGYTVSDRGNGWKFNDPDGKWSEQSFTTENYAWEGAYADSLARTP